jgi:hypothetical protein
MMNLFSFPTFNKPVTPVSEPVVEPVAEPAVLGVGSKVMWRGFELTIVEMKADGSIEAWSPVFRVTAVPTEFTASK